MPISNHDINLYRKKLQEWKKDWNKFACDALRVRLDKEQQEILHAIEHNRRVSVCSGVGRGKDFLAATGSLCFLFLTPYWDDKGILHTSTVINTGPTGRQVKNIMMREIKARYNGSILPSLSSFGFNAGRLVADGIKFDMPPDLKGNNAYANIEKWYLLAFKADDDEPEVWTGFHNTNIMVVATEASGLSNLLFDGMEGCLQGNSKFLIVFNPNNTTGEAYNSCKDPQYKFFRLNSLDSLNVKLGLKLHKGLITQQQYDKYKIPGQTGYDWVYEHLNKRSWTLKIPKKEFDVTKDDFEFDGQCYRPSDACRIKILGIPPETTEDTLIPLNWIDAAHQRWYDRKEPEIKGKLGVDIAGMGNDSTVFVERRNDYVLPIRVFPNTGSSKMHMQIAECIFADKDNYEEVYVDAIGEGAGVYSRLKDLEMDNAFSFKGSYGAKGLIDKTEVRKFLNMRAYAYWCMRDWFDPQFDSTACLPPDDELDAQLTETKYEIHNGIIRIEDKGDITERLGESPDKADGLSMTFAPRERLTRTNARNIITPRGRSFLS